MKDLGHKSVAAVKWGAVSTIARFGLQLLAQVILARILGPEVYGIFGMGLVVYAFCVFMANTGLGWSLMQRPTVSDEDIRFAFTWQTLMGSVGTAVLLLAAPWIAQYFSEPRVEDVVRGLSLSCVLAAAASPAGNLLQRAMRFKTIGLIQVLSYVVGYLLIGLPLAFLTHSVHALVAAWVGQALVTLVANYIAVRHPIKPLLWYDGARSMFGHSGLVFATNICNWWLSNLDRLVIGRLLNAHQMGVYTAGYNLANLPNSLLINALQPAFLSAGARVQDDVSRLRNAYLQVLSAIIVLLMPAFVFLSAMASPIIGLLYGQRWDAAAPVAQVLFLIMPAYIAWGLSTPILWNTQKGQLEVLLQLPLIALAIGAYLAWSGNGVAAAAQVTAALLVARGLVLVLAACHRLTIAPVTLLPLLWRGALLSATVALGSCLGLHLAIRLHPENGALFWDHVIDIGVAGAVALAMVSAIVAIRPQVVGSDTLRMIQRFLPARRLSS